MTRTPRPAGATSAIGAGVARAGAVALLLGLTVSLAGCPDDDAPAADAVADTDGGVDADATAETADDADVEGDATPDTDAGGPDGDVGDVGPDVDPDVDGDAAPEVDADTVEDVDADGGPDEGTDTDDDASDGADAPDGADGSDGTDGSDGAGDVDGDGDGDVFEGCLSDDDCALQNTNSCVTSTCDHATMECVDTPKVDGEACEDGNFCSTGETCSAGVCIGGSAINCNDDNVCTDDICLPAQGCVNNVNFAGCEDGDPCTEGDTCFAGTCTPGEPKCDDGNDCTADTCDAAGACDFAPLDGIACDDGSDCTTGDACSGGACAPGAGDGCEDGNPCTLTMCAADGVTCEGVALNGEPCDDGNPCTENDVCAGANCASGQPLLCDDDNDCTTDTCDPEGVGCVFTLVEGSACDDGDACTAAEVCDAAGVCGSGTPVDCDDGNLCTSEVCDSVEGCVTTNLDIPCPDGNACTINEVCVDGSCQTEALDCDDDDACTSDQCDPVLGCQTIDISAACGDDDPCTDDGCDPVEGCVVSLNAAPCDDGDNCTGPDACDEGTCAGPPLDCDDDDQCTLDVCTVEDGCVNAPFTGSCDDGDLCTEDEVCEADAVCDGGTAVDPDDGIDCTVDACDSATGVSNTPDDAMCPLGQVCQTVTGCDWGDVKILVTRVMLDPTADDDSVDGQGQWLSVMNIGTIPVDLSLFEVRNGAGTDAQIAAIDGMPGQVVLSPGAMIAGIKAPEQLPADVPAGFGFVFGTFGDGFGFDDTGDQIIVRSVEPGVTDSTSFNNIVSDGDVGTTATPVVTGQPTDLNRDVALAATSPFGNDNGANWCLSVETSPTAPLTECDRIVLNEVQLSAAEGERFVEIWAPAGGNAGSMLLRFIDADGAVVNQVLLNATARVPIGPTLFRRDGDDGVVLPQLTAGAVQLLRDNDLQDVVGWGALNAAVDQQLGLPLFETAVAPAPTATESSARGSGGADTDDNASDFTLGPSTLGMQN